jgi:pilus assembly protein Flp/PilA
MIIKLRNTLRRADGASAVEYALLIAAIAAIIVAIVFVLGGRVKSAFSKTNSCISAEGQTSACGGRSGGSSGGDRD